MKNICCICGHEFTGYGNNPYPIKSEGVCCDACDQKVVRVRNWVAETDINPSEPPFDCDGNLTQSAIKDIRKSLDNWNPLIFPQLETTKTVFYELYLTNDLLKKFEKVEPDWKKTYCSKGWGHYLEEVKFLMKLGVIKAC